MKRTYRIAGKVIASGLLGIVLFIGSIFLAAFLMPASNHPDVVEGWTAALFLIMGMLLAIFMSGVVAVLLTFNDISSLREALVISFFSGLVTTIIPLLIGAFLGTHSAGIFYLCLVVVAVCIMLSIAGGIIVFLILSYLKNRRLKRQAPGQI